MFELQHTQGDAYAGTLYMYDTGARFTQSHRQPIDSSVYLQTAFVASSTACVARSHGTLTLWPTDSDTYIGPMYKVRIGSQDGNQWYYGSCHLSCIIFEGLVSCRRLGRRFQAAETNSHW